MRIIFVLIIGVFMLRCSKDKSTDKFPYAKEFDELVLLADSCYNTNQYRQAIEYYDKIIEVDSSKGEFYFRRAYCKDQFFDFEGSSKDYMKSIQLNYKPSESYYNLGLSQIMLLNDSLAVRCFEKSLELNPNDPQVLSLLETYKRRLKQDDINL